MSRHPPGAGVALLALRAVAPSTSAAEAVVIADYRTLTFGAVLVLTLLFQVRQAAADGGLLDLQALGRLRETTGASQCEKGARVVPVQVSR
ncbi:hypothetical protein RCF34_07845 [Pseudomonas sp. 102515]|nr:hypothetical protein [Pseudomonas sp. 102515]MDQ7913023.1 hypothetical protein [Pseudomonas sp. 102515]